MKKKLSIMWFRQDLRLADNPALCKAVKSGHVLPIYILDDVSAGNWQMGGANRVWLHHSLLALYKSLDGMLSLYHGNAADVFESLLSRFDVVNVFWNRCYEPWRVSRDGMIKSMLQDRGVSAKSLCGSLLWEPWEVAKADGTPYRVFSPFYYKGCHAASPPREPLPVPSSISAAVDDLSLPLEKLQLLPSHPRWDEAMMAHWEPGEAGAYECLEIFLANGLSGYKEGRNVPSKANVSRLSPYLQTGEISPNTVWYRARSVAEGKDLDHFCSELGWREFAYHLLYHFPNLPEENFQAKFDTFPWGENNDALSAWQRGMTGIPIVDAGMRELWQTGYMHNRVRMIVASFLIKNLLIDWRKGEVWFWDTLVDADLANNSASWQWVAGSGADAAPYFRIFNPVSQGLKFDPKGVYIRKYVPELQDMPDKYLFAPWEAPADVLENAGVGLGTDYPKPIVDLKTSRVRALDAFKSLKNLT
ncbi:cryptochrome/photolyase family protein [Kordiimonas aquimaris]|uniref:cryptochrome/photolyase family protein n=1 Tax=Kordiimonas aquimaris TaxID=707591 RepID=UPI0021D2C68E|nr:deoxyribodipyrimidine photo-lyase [Kordiimonas aquimaris]